MLWVSVDGAIGWDVVGRSRRWSQSSTVDGLLEIFRSPIILDAEAGLAPLLLGVRPNWLWKAENGES